MKLQSIADQLSGEDTWAFARMAATRLYPTLNLGPAGQRAGDHIIDLLAADTTREQLTDALFVFDTATFTDPTPDGLSTEEETQHYEQLRGWTRLLHSPFLRELGGTIAHYAARIDDDPNAQWADLATLNGLTGPDRDIWVALADTWDGTPEELTATCARAVTT